MATPSRWTLPRFTTTSTSTLGSSSSFGSLTSATISSGLLIQDIVDLITPLLSRTDLCHCCLVSQTWYDLFIPSVWSNSYNHRHKDRGTSNHVYEIPKAILKTLATTATDAEKTFHSEQGRRDLFIRVGRYIRYLIADSWHPVEDQFDLFLEIVRETCWSLQHLKLQHRCLTSDRFERLILGVETTRRGRDCSAAASISTTQINWTKPQVTEILRSPTNAFLSDSLRTLELRVHPLSAESIMHWFGLAARKHHRLSNLEEFALSSCYPRRKHELQEYVEVPFRLSMLLLFLRSWNNRTRQNGKKVRATLEKVTILFGDVYDDMEDNDIAEEKDEGEIVYVSKNWSRPTDLPPRRGAAQEPASSVGLHSGERQDYTSSISLLHLWQVRSPRTLSKLLHRLPYLKTLAIQYFDDPNFLKSLRIHAPQLDILRCPANSTVFQEQDWLDYCDPSRPSHRDRNHLKHPTSRSHCHRIQGLEFGYYRRDHVTDNVLKSVALPLQASQFHTLILDNSLNLTWEGILTLLQNCPRLEILKVKYLLLDGTLFQRRRGDWACYATLRELCMANIRFHGRPEHGHPDRDQEPHSRALRRHLHLLEKIEDLWIDGDMFMTKECLLFSPDETMEETIMPKPKLHLKRLYWPVGEDSLSGIDYRWINYLFPNSTDMNFDVDLYDYY
ncbi:hypothetical protein BGZ83_000573 [Gryganskiella cystojenkinii]|nr:hypothetical protein BGZ83_000573 [Gryganskiella cystojenkinii]